MSDEDAHAKAYDAGESAFQILAFAESWIANPTLSEAQLRADEPDERVFRREYAAIPQASVIDGYLADVIRQCIDPKRTLPTTEPKPGITYAIAIDPAWRRDEFALAVARCELREGASHVIVEHVLGWRAAPGQVLSVEHTLDRVAEVCGLFRTGHVFSDQKDEDSLRALLAQRGIGLIGVPWTATNKAAKFRAFRALAMDQRVHLPDEVTTIAQLEGICIELTPSGTETFRGRGSDDRAFAVVMSSLEALRTPSASSEDQRQHALGIERYADAATKQMFARVWPRTFGSEFTRDRDIDVRNFDPDEIEAAPDLLNWHRGNLQ